MQGFLIFFFQSVYLAAQHKAVDVEKHTRGALGRRGRRLRGRVPGDPRPPHQPHQPSRGLHGPPRPPRVRVSVRSTP